MPKTAPHWLDQLESLARSVANTGDERPPNVFTTTELGRVLGVKSAQAWRRANELADEGKIRPVKAKLSDRYGGVQERPAWLIVKPLKRKGKHA